MTLAATTTSDPEVTVGAGQTTTSAPAPAPTAAPSPAPAAPTGDVPSADVEPAEGATSDKTSTTQTDPSTSTGEAAPAPAPAADTAGVVDESTIDWNGEVDSLKSAEWFNQIDEKYRNPILAGIEKKHKNLESGFTKKTQELAETRKGLEAQLAEVKAKDAERERELNYYRRFLDTGASPSDQMVEEAKQLRAELAQSKVDREALETELREALLKEFNEQQLTPLQEQLTKAQEEIAQRDQVLEEQRKAAEKAQEERNQQVLAQLSLWVDKEAPALWEDANEPALEMFENLLRSQVATDPETALKMVGSVYPKLSPTAAEEVPDSVAVMHADSTVSYGPLGETTSLPYAEVKRRMMKGITKG